ncbi:MAG TPA: hypothetical protein VGS28_04205 [Candidatus Saccharimonadales bacterium]|nr:hypothetical protein [Candidatus Saccharimonadales bacterium]
MSRVALSGEPKLHVKILSPTQVYYNSLALSVSARNKVGPFDILDGHANFFSILTKGDVSVNIGMGSKILTFPISGGIMKVTQNKVTLFVDIDSGYLAATEAKSAKA